MIGIMFPMLVMDWNYNRPGFTIPLFLSYPGAIAGLCFSLLFLLCSLPFAISKAAYTMLKKYIYLVFGVFLILTIQSITYPDAMKTYSRFLVLDSITMLLFALSGFVYAAKPDTACKLLNGFAKCAAWGSFITFTLRFAGLPDSVPFGIASGQVRLFFLFGFCWYLAHYVASTKKSGWMLLGLLACCLELIFTLHKPFIWSAAFAITALLLIFRFHLPRRQFGKIMSMLIKITIVPALMLITVNIVFDGIVTRELNDFIYNRVLHMSDGDNAFSMEHADGLRFELWSTVLEDFGDSPWVGSGVKMIDFFGTDVYMHNGYLDLLFISGICGFILFICGLGIWFKAVVKSLSNTTILLSQASCIAYLTGIMMYNLGGTSRLFSGISYFITLVLGISLRMAADSLATKTDACPDLVKKPDVNSKNDHIYVK